MKLRLFLVLPLVLPHHLIQEGGGACCHGSGGLVIISKHINWLCKEQGRDEKEKEEEEEGEEEEKEEENKEEEGTVLCRRGLRAHASLKH